MSRIRSKDTKPEIALRKALHKLGLRYRLHSKNIEGTPDVAIKKYSVAIFVNGCFWHRHEGCSIATTPKSNTKFWQEKFRRNVERDEKNTRSLQMKGWKVFTVWECELSTISKAESTASDLYAKITKKPELLQG